MTDSEVIGTWREIRHAAALLDVTVASMVTAAECPDSQISEARAALAGAPHRMLPMTELARRVGLSSGGLTKLVDQIADAGLVYRQHCETDRRVVFAVLTDHGVTAEPESTAAYAAALRAELAALGARRLAAVHEISAMFERDLGRKPADSDGSTSQAPPCITRRTTNPRTAAATRKRAAPTRYPLGESSADPSRLSGSA